HNGGELAVAAGGAVKFHGRVRGNGSFAGGGTFDFEDHYSPGSSPARASVDGDVVFGTNGSLDLELAGTTPGSGYDQLAVTRSVTLNDVEISLIDGFVPKLGDTF